MKVKELRWVQKTSVTYTTPIAVSSMPQAYVTHKSRTLEETLASQMPSTIEAKVIMVRS